MEEKQRVNQAPEKPHAIENFRTLRPGYESNGKSCTTSHRTEDIHVREDEDGFRSHFCPLDKAQDNDTEDEEDIPDMPLSVDFDEIPTGCSLKSEEVPWLDAERPPLSDREEIANSYVDTSTAMIYSQPCNRSPESEKLLQSRLGYRFTNYGDKRLGEETMTSWVESSDDDEFYINKGNDTELLLEQLGEESDMEEFKETENINYEILESSQDEKKPFTGKYKEALGVKESSNGQTNPRYSGEYSKRSGSNDNFQTKNIRESGADGSSTSRATNNNTKLSEVKRKTDKNSETENDTKCDTGKVQTDRAEECSRKQCDMKDLCPSGRDPMKSILFAESENISILTVLSRHTVAANEDEDKNSIYEKKGRDWTGESDKSKTDAAYPNSIDYRDQEQPHLFPQEDEKSKEADDKKNDLALEPPGAGKPPDLATQLRFMTEIYNNDDDEIYSETLSVSELPLEVKEKDVGSAVSDDYKGAQRDEQTVAIELPLKSSTFESVLTEEQRAVIRPRNKLTKFFKSFKLRLTKKS